jgi:hypothetical protein
MSTPTLNESTIRSRARRAGYSIVKSRTAESVHNLGGHMIVDDAINGIAAGENFDLSLADVAEWLPGQR